MTHSDSSTTSTVSVSTHPWSTMHWVNSHLVSITLSTQFYWFLIQLKGPCHCRPNMDMISSTDSTKCLTTVTCLTVGKPLHSLFVKIYCTVFRWAIFCVFYFAQDVREWTMTGLVSSLFFKSWRIVRQFRCGHSEWRLDIMKFPQCFWNRRFTTQWSVPI